MSTPANPASEADRLREFRRKLREGHPAQVVNGEVVSVDGKAPPAAAVPGVQVKPHDWGASCIDTPAGESRVLKEQRLLQRAYPGFEIDVEPDGTPVVTGQLGPNATLRAGYQILLRLPPGYGHGALPQAFVLAPALRDQAPHRYRDGSLCLDHSGAFTGRSTLLTFLAWVSVWLCLYEGWLETGVPW